jgi:hypothetical protein
MNTAAEAAILAQLKPVGMRLLVFGGDVVASLAFAASQVDNDPHWSLILSESCPDSRPIA